MFEKNEIEGIDFIHAEPEMFTNEEHDWFLREELESLAHPHETLVGHAWEAPHIPYIKTEQVEKRSKKLSDFISDLFDSVGGLHDRSHHRYTHLVRGVVFQGVLNTDVNQVIDNHQIGMIECN